VAIKVRDKERVPRNSSWYRWSSLQN